MFSGSHLLANMSSPEYQESSYESSSESSSEFESPPKRKCICKTTTPLHEAIKDGDEYFIEKMFHYKCELDINALDSIGLTPLLLAILKKEEKIAKLLIENGASVNRSSQVLKMLPEVDALVEETKNDFDDCSKSAYKNLRPLHCAALIGSYQIVCELLKKGAIHSDYYYPTPLHCAVHSDSPEIVELLLENGAEVGPMQYGEDLTNSLYDFSLFPEIKISLELTMEERVLGMAAARGKIKVLKMLLDKGTKINNRKIISFAGANGFEKSLKITHKLE